MSLNLKAIHPLYAPPEFANLYMRFLAENMTNENWLDISLEQRMWISRSLAFNHLYTAERFPESGYTASFNATVEETCRRRQQAQSVPELAQAITTSFHSQSNLNPSKPAGAANIATEATHADQQSSMRILDKPELLNTKINSGDGSRFMSYKGYHVKGGNRGKGRKPRPTRRERLLRKLHDAEAVDISGSAKDDTDLGLVCQKSRQGISS